ncbi:MAG: ATP-binding protein, partial [Pseudomonadota bacterium]
MNAFLKTAGISREIDDEIILENLGVAERIDNRLRMKNVGVLFFSRSIETLCEQATVTCAVFDGTERIHVINRKDYQEDIITNIDYVMHFIKQELRVRYAMTGRPQREEIYEIPLDAIREAVVNAVSHRDYFQYGAHTTVEVFDDRIELSNPGGLPKGLPPEEFGKRAMRRNQIIASLLQRVRLVENMGTGINKIRRLLKEAKCAGPRFDFGSFFTIVFPRTEKKV